MVGFIRLNHEVITIKIRFKDLMGRLRVKIRQNRLGQRNLTNLLVCGTVFIYNCNFYS